MGKFGFCKPEEPVNHPDAGKRTARIVATDAATDAAAALATRPHNSLSPPTEGPERSACCMQLKHGARTSSTTRDSSSPAKDMCKEHHSPCARPPPALLALLDASLHIRVAPREGALARGLAFRGRREGRLHFRSLLAQQPYVARRDQHVRVEPRAQ